MKKILIGVLLAGGLVALGLLGVILAGTASVVDEVDNAIQEEEARSQAVDEALQAMLDEAPEPEITRNEWEYIVTYTMTATQDFDYIQLEYDVFDAEGVKIANDFTNISDVKEGQTFKMTLNLYQDGAEDYDITKITNGVF